MQGRTLRVAAHQEDSKFLDNVGNGVENATGKYKWVSWVYCVQKQNSKDKVIWRLEAVLIHINSKHFCCVINTSLTKPCSFQSVFMDLNAWSVKHAVYNGNRTEWSPIQSVIIPVINKIGRPRRQNSSLPYEYNIRQQVMRIQKDIN